MRMFDLLCVQSAVKNLLRMTILEHVPHSIRRKIFAPHYAVGNLIKFQAEMHKLALELVKVSPCFYLLYLLTSI